MTTTTGKGRQSPLVLTLVVILGVGGIITATVPAAQAQQSDQAYVEGRITVDEEIDDTGDYGGIGVEIIDRSTTPPDTLFSAVTDTDGHFSGTARVPQRQRYGMQVTRHGSVLAEATLVLAGNDTIRLSGELPQFDRTFEMDSRENNAMATFQRLQRQYSRVATMINAGNVEDEDIPEQINTWSELFWSLRQEYPGTLAAEEATSRALDVMFGWNNERLLQLVRGNLDDERVLNAGSYYGLLAKLQTGADLDDAMAFLDTLAQHTTSDETRRSIAMNRIEVLYDSARVDQAHATLEQFEQQHGDDPDLQDWIASVRYDLENLAPGMQVPSFSASFGQHGVISDQDLVGRPHIIEVVQVSGGAYEQAHEVLRQFMERHGDQGLRILTIPVEQEQEAVDSFFDERGREWPVADAGAFAENDIGAIFNVEELPTRILVDEQGQVVRKYMGQQLQILESDLQRLLTQGELE